MLSPSGSGTAIATEPPKHLNQTLKSEMGIAAGREREGGGRTGKRGGKRSESFGTSIARRALAPFGFGEEAASELRESVREGEADQGGERGGTRLTATEKAEAECERRERDFAQLQIRSVASARPPFSLAKVEWTWTPISSEGGRFSERQRNGMGWERWR